MTDRSRCLSYVALALMVAQGLLFVVSWLITAARPEIAMHSLLSSEGLRWFFGRFVYNLATPVLVWMLLLSVAYGAVTSSGLGDMLKHGLHRLYRGKNSNDGAQLSYRQRFALRTVMLEGFIIVLVMLLLTAIPHAVLLSVTGQLFPSSFSVSIVPVLAFSFCLFGITYGVMGGQFHSVPEVFRSLCANASRVAPYFILYVLVAELYFSVRYVFML